MMILWALSSPVALSAAPISYVPLQPVPGVPVGNADFKTYLIAGFKIGISVAGILSVLMLVVAGFQYATTDAFTGKEESKNKMTKVVYGLVLILVSYILLNTVNKDTVSLKLDFGAQDAVNRIGGGFRDGLAYNRAQAILNQKLREAVSQYSEGRAEIDTLTSRINDLNERMENNIDNPMEYERLRVQAADLENQKNILGQQIESARVMSVYQTDYDKAMLEINNKAINKDGYLLAKKNFETAQTYYSQVKRSLEAGDQASKDAAKALDIRWTRQLEDYNKKLTEIETKYPVFTQGNQTYTGQNYFVTGTPVR